MVVDMIMTTEFLKRIYNTVSRFIVQSINDRLLKHGTSFLLTHLFWNMQASFAKLKSWILIPYRNMFLNLQITNEEEGRKRKLHNVSLPASICVERNDDDETMENVPEF